MHVTTIKQEIVDKYPWVPTNLVKAFEQAKQIAYRRVANPRMIPLAWVRTAVEEQEAVLGRDPWAYGLTPANRKNLETVLRYTHQQGMISRMPPLDELFADTDLGDAGGSEGILMTTHDFRGTARRHPRRHDRAGLDSWSPSMTARISSRRPTRSSC